MRPSNTIPPPFSIIMTPSISIDLDSRGSSHCYPLPKRRSSVTGTEDTTGGAASHTRRAPKKSVSFESKVQVRTTLHISNYREKEIKRCWFTLEECAAIRSKAKKTAAQIEAESDAGSCSSPTSVRGLESMVRATREEKRNLRDNSIYTVIEEQELQFYEGHDSERLAEIYRYASAPARGVPM